MVNLASIIEPHPGDDVAIVSRGKPTTYGELRDQVAALRGAFIAHGLEPGDRVAIACGNNWYFVVSYLATVGAGLVAVPLNPSAPPPELEYQVGSTTTRALVVGPAAVHTAQGLDRSKLPSLDLVIAPRGSDVPDAVDLEDMLAAAPAPVVEREPDDLAVLLFTSGTAGAPRAAMLSHGNLLANLDQAQAVNARRQGPDDVVLGILPLFHIFGLNVMLDLTLQSGSSIVLVERFDPATAIDTIRDHGITIVSGPPTMWAAWAGLPGIPPDAFSTVRIAVSGAAKLPVETAQLIEDRFGVHIGDVSVSP